jgi:GT2 family glycosyltransferase
MKDFKIYYSTPYNLNKNLGSEYNHYMSLIKRDRDWMCFVDGDTMFLTPDFGKQIHDIVTKYPETGMFTCMTNRVGISLQRHNKLMSENANLSHHKEIALQLQKKFYDTVEVVNRRVSGLMMLIQKNTWRQVKFRDGLLGVDFAFCDDLIASGYDIKIMKGVYLMHYYRLLEGRHYKGHLILS